VCPELGRAEWFPFSWAGEIFGCRQAPWLACALDLPEQRDGTVKAAGSKSEDMARVQPAAAARMSRATATLGVPVGAGNRVTSCNLVVFVDEAAEPVAPYHADTTTFGRRIGSPGGWALAQCPVWPVGVVMIVWVPITLSRYATWEYSQIRPPSRSRRRTRTLASRAGGCGRPARGLCCSARCGR
jgi:hypothetical protein